MKITDLSVTLFNWNSTPWKTGVASFGGHKVLGVVTVHSDEGVEGHAFLGSSRQGADDLVGLLMGFAKPALVGRHPLDIGAIWASMWKLNRSISTHTIGAVDIALWDIAGKVGGLPIQRLLGSCRDRVPAYASSAWLDSPEGYVAEALHFRSLGWMPTRFIPMRCPMKTLRFAGRSAMPWITIWS
jgi:L-alanine-DL-glutamate epimerase-like enolase superfamily enzyme